MKAWTGTRPSRVLQGRGWDLTANLAPCLRGGAVGGPSPGGLLPAATPAVAHTLGMGMPAAAVGLPPAAMGLPAAAVGLPAAALGLPAAAHPKSVVVRPHEGHFHKSLPAVTTAAAAAGGKASHKGPFHKSLPAATAAVALTLGVGMLLGSRPSCDATTTPL